MPPRNLAIQKVMIFSEFGRPRLSCLIVHMHQVLKLITYFSFSMVYSDRPGLGNPNFQ